MKALFLVAALVASSAYAGDCPRQLITPKCPLSTKMLGQMLPSKDLGQTYTAIEGKEVSGRTVPSGTQYWQCLATDGHAEWKLIAYACR